MKKTKEMRTVQEIQMFLKILLIQEIICKTDEVTNLMERLIYCIHPDAKKENMEQYYQEVYEIIQACKQ